MLVEFVIINFGACDELLFSDMAKDVAAQLNIPMPPRVGERIQLCLNGEDRHSGRYAILEVVQVQYGERRGQEVGTDVGAICNSKVIETWRRGG